MPTKKEEKVGIRKQFKKSLSTAIITAFSLLAALSWADVIKGYINRVESLSIAQGNLITALIVTFLAAIAILITSNINN